MGSDGVSSSHRGGEPSWAETRLALMTASDCSSREQKAKSAGNRRVVGLLL